MQALPATPIAPSNGQAEICQYTASAAGMRLDFYGTHTQLENWLADATVQDLPHRKVVTWAVRNKSTKATYGLRISHSHSTGEVKVCTTLCP